MYDAAIYTFLFVTAMIFLLTDFGAKDVFVGVMKAVIAGIAPECSVIDLTHEIPPQDVAYGAWSLSCAAPYLPSGSIVSAVVDPGVGTARRAIAAVMADGTAYVAPDNGLLTYILQKYACVYAIELNNPEYWIAPDLAQISATFHGRDIFAPAAAWLSRGISAAAMGTAVPTESLIRLPILQPKITENTLETHVAAIDHFGNIITTVDAKTALALFARYAVIAEIHHTMVEKFAQSFAAGPADAPFWYIDSSGYAAIAWKNDSAARRLRVTVGMPVRCVFKEGK